MVVDGKTLRSIPPDESLTHPFAVPQLDILVPLPGRPTKKRKTSAKEGPVQPEPGAQDHHLHDSHRRSGVSNRWQCFVPCAAGVPRRFRGPDARRSATMDGFPPGRVR